MSELVNILERYMKENKIDFDIDCDIDSEIDLYIGGELMIVE